MLNKNTLLFLKNALYATIYAHVSNLVFNFILIMGGILVGVVFDLLNRTCRLKKNRKKYFV